MSTTSGGGQRAFAQKLSRYQAADVRRRVAASSSIGSGDNPFNRVSTARQSSVPGSISGVTVASTTARESSVEPPDYEEILEQNLEAVARDPLREVLRFPDDDVEVVCVPRRCRTVVPLLPEIDPGAGPVEPRLGDCVRSYTRDWIAVHRRYQQHSSSLVSPRQSYERMTVLSPPKKQEYEVDLVQSAVADDDEDDDGDKNGPTSTNSAANSCRSSVHMDEETPRGSWASSIFDLRNSVADPLIQGILDSTLVPKNNHSSHDSRMPGRHEMLFSLYPPSAFEEPLEKRLPADIPSEHAGHKILVKIHQLKLELEVEPIFASMAVYDVKERKKISENFYFDLNSDSLKSMLGPHLKPQDPSTFSKSCVFDLSSPSPDIYIIIRLEKVLQGDINECVEPYVKEDKNREKVKANAMTACERLGRYRMPFAWTYISLMHVINPNNAAATSSQSSGGTLDSRDSGSDKGSANSSLERKTSASQKDYPSTEAPPLKPRKIGSCSGLLEETTSTHTKKSSLERSASTRQSGSTTGALSTTSAVSSSATLDKRPVWSSEDVAHALDSFRAVTLTMTSFFKQEPDKMRDEDLYKILLDYRRHQAAHKRLKSIPGLLKMEFCPCPHELPHMVTSELAKLKPYPDANAIPTKEILEFRPRPDPYTPNYVYRNLLYVYPREVNLTNRPGGSARNIACQIEYRVGEYEEDALPVIFGKSSSPEWERRVRTSVTYHNRSPCFYDEFKLKVPAKLEHKHHLLFTFYHVSCQKKEAQNQVETPVGYTWLPLVKDGGLVAGELNLPVMIDPPPKDYSLVGPEVQVPHYKWVDNHKPVFSVTVRPVSTLHALDRHIDRFLNLCSEIERGEPLPRYLLGEGNAERELKTSIDELKYASLEALVSFLPIVLDKLILSIVRPPRVGQQVLNVSQACFEAMGTAAQRISGGLESQNDHIGRNPLLSTYVSYEATLPHPGAAPGIGGGYSPSRGPNFRSWEHPGSIVAGLDQRTVGVYRQTSGFDGSGLPGAEDTSSGQQSVRKLVHEELALQWVVSSGTARELALTNAWFFLELMVKSMTEHLRACGGLSGVPRKNRFPEQFTDDVSSLVSSLTADVIAKFTRDARDLKSVTRLNSSLAFFVQDLLSIMDRGYVFGLIRDYCKRMDMKIESLPDAGYLLTYKLDFLRIVCSHEHVIALNLPFGTPLCPPGLAVNRGLAPSPTPSVSSQSSWVSTLVGGGNRWNYAELTAEYRQHHFLAGLILSNLQTALETAQSSAVLNRAVETVRNLLWCHDVDTRYTIEKKGMHDGIECSAKSRVACLYLPLIGIVLDAIGQMHRPSPEENKFNRGTNRRLGRAASMNRSVSLGNGGTGSDFEAAGNSKGEGGASHRHPLTAESTKHLLVCLLWVLKNVEPSLVKAWWCEMPVARLHELLDVLHIAVSCFEYCGKRTLRKAQERALRKPHGETDLAKSRLEDMLFGVNSARSEMLRRRNAQASPAFANSQFYDARDSSGPNSMPNVQPGSSSPMPSLRWNKDQWRTPVVSTAASKASTLVPSIHHSTSGSLLDTDAAVLGNLAAECMLVILDTLELVTQVSMCHSAESAAQSLLGEVLKVLLHALSRNQATSVLCALFGFQRSLLVKFPNLIFEEDSEFCADLCLQLLSHCGSAISTVRAQAAASMYALMRQNFEIGNNFARVKMQVTMSLSSLVGTSSVFNEDFLRRSLKTILTYAEEDTECHEDYSSFPEQVRDLVFNLHMILSDTVKMKEYQQDPEMLLDLMYRIAKGYQNSPDLRLTWLANMAQNHSKQGNHAEAAMCLVHSAALVSEYLLMIEDKVHMPRGAVAFEAVSPNVSEESAVSDDVVSPDDQGGATGGGGGLGGGSCSGKYFTEAGLCGLIEQAANSFHCAGMYESIDKVYKVLLPIVEFSHDYKKLSNIHGKLREAYEKIDQLQGKRVFGTYFRVGFYGPMFGDLDGEEFVYKEPPLTKLSEISDRLETFYAERFGEDKVLIVKDSNPVNPKKLTLDKAYIQITYVEPYFESYEARRRVTGFHLNDCLKHFIFSTPFTRDSNRPHGELHEQHKRKTILTTQSHFPYVKTRIPVTSKRCVTLSPIEVAIEDIQKKSKELAAALYQNPPDPKILQMVLQGCIGTTVNQGPLEVAHVFLSDLKDGIKTPTKLQHKLRLCFKDFSKKCADALTKNKTLIGPDQRDYQRELENNYKNFTRQLAPMVTLSRPGGGLAVSSADGSIAANQDPNHRIWKHISALPGHDFTDGFPTVRSSPVV